MSHRQSPRSRASSTLPRELRDLIYEFACEGSTASIKGIFANTDEGTPSDPNVILATSNSNVSILQVSSQIRHEVEPIYYRRTIFTFSNSDACVAWLKRRVPRPLIHHLRHLRVGDIRSHDIRESLKQTLLEPGDGLLLALGACVIREQAMCILKFTLIELIDEGLRPR